MKQTGYHDFPIDNFFEIFSNHLDPLIRKEKTVSQILEDWLVPLIKMALFLRLVRMV